MTGSERPHVVLAGAGIGGLAAALALHDAGYSVTVLDQVRRLRPLGVGINLQPHAAAVLADLGLADWLTTRGVTMTEHVYLDAAGRQQFTEPRGEARGHRWPQYAVHRGELQMELLARVRTRCGIDTVRTGTRVTAVEQDHDEVRVGVTDRQTGATTTLTADLLVGCDGLHSAVRAVLHPDEGPLLHSGIGMWRGVTEGPSFLGGHAMMLAHDGHGVRVVAYPIHDPDRGGEVVNWVCQIPVCEPGPVAGDVGWNRPGTAVDLLPHLRDWDLGVVDVTGLIGDTQKIFEFPMVDRDPLRSWGDGRVTLLGDAAHPMYPVGANGATQAIVDARALADGLAGADDPVRGLAWYEMDRLEATSGIVEANREMDRAERAAREGLTIVGDEQAGENAVMITERYRCATGGEV